MVRGLSLALVATTVIVSLSLVAGVHGEPCGDRIVNNTEKPICKGGSGTFLPAFNAYGEDNWSDGLKIFLYLAGLLWTFSGIGIITDVFMEAIEVITSKEKEVKLKDGRVVHVQVWNPTIANLSLMALGSSAPEIILSVIEVVAGNFFAGALGPSTIVGSAAFNLLVIFAVCSLAVPQGEVRRLEQYGVFIVTAIFSVFAYVWLIIILVVSSPNVVEVWEGVLTLLFFPMLLGLSFMADRGYFDFGKRHPASVDNVLRIDNDVEHGHQFHDPYEADTIIKRIARSNSMTMEDKVNLALAKKLKGERVSRAQFRIDATRKLVGSGGILPDYNKAKLQEALLRDDFFEAHKTKLAKKNFVGLESLQYSIGEGDGHVNVKILRTGDLSLPLTIEYYTEGDTATMGVDFEETKGVAEFSAGEEEKVIPIKIIDDDEEEDDEHFYFYIKNPSPEQYLIVPGRNRARITIIDDDHPGVVSLELSKFSCLENVGTIFLSVLRQNGSKGELKVNYATQDGTAHAPHDYEETKGTLVFEDGETEKVIAINIVDDEEYELDEHFFLTLEESEDVTFGEVTKCKITILNDDEVTTLADKVTALLNLNLDKFRIGGTDWKSQFVDALAWPEEGSGTFAIVMHLINIPWKIIAACLPPTLFLNGWVTFGSALIMIGIVTATIGDLASLMGCAMGLEDAVTAITFVALGTSLPDTFASMSATIASDTADAAITNVTGSNSVNVFLGLGLSWIIAAIYWPVVGKTDEWIATVPPCINAKYSNAVFWVPSGDLAFSVIIFSLCCIICLGTLVVRRYTVGAELGGAYAKPTAALFLTLWLMYILLSSLSTYEHISL
ncbi:Na+/Ca2+ exchanger NCX3 isoform [Salpingoeca rosetta]|uniref:Na+/Ca2+ exchanger NCX3 isoform n=1 Tax=Salpingoeca rosetta (strain ATCC 50818 / BSB-021) TaxID=946362 RepID=F2U583_SALR5|nr:Na+/Ca2+ exchanger NCX3 isoform [Salpingoeca rosetta]EGD82799.1 Na+/Ca2+ exchanger NCX3 isoform [Salpingoeca rosetta]|eukprot:XP_004996034.1 Na+/Ca2+ exchanger NCX3 isoform [Salpingoeca rosetta]